MQKMQPLQPLIWKNELFFASRDHCEDIGPLGFYGHSSSIGLTMFDRIRMYMDHNVPGMLAENVCYGTLNPLEAIILMLIDDGDPKERKMRENLLDPIHRYVGFATNRHKF